jgi:hypothetical protein
MRLWHQVFGSGDLGVGRREIPVVVQSYLSGYRYRFHTIIDRNLRFHESHVWSDSDPWALIRPKSLVRRLEYLKLEVADNAQNPSKDRQNSSEAPTGSIRSPFQCPQNERQHQSQRRNNTQIARLAFLGTLLHGKL